MSTGHGERRRRAKRAGFEAAGATVVSDGTPISSRLRRTSRLGGLVAVQGGRIAGGRALDRVRSDEGRDRAQAARTADVVEQIVVQLGTMKGAAMKIGQVISTVEFPGMEAEAGERIQRRLAELRDAAPTVQWPKMEKLMVAEWGEPVAAVLADIEPEAMAAASIGQVHRATTRDGADVAVKVQYPGIAEAVEADLRNLRVLPRSSTTSSRRPTSAASSAGGAAIRTSSSRACTPRCPPAACSSPSATRGCASTT
jgi:predicted unusual protein kinase regulating ubiquinone biosynthesis (AarF/ABC1/UbiB family)